MYIYYDNLIKDSLIASTESKHKIGKTPSSRPPAVQGFEVLGLRQYAERYYCQRQKLEQLHVGLPYIVMSQSVVGKKRRDTTSTLFV
jgi:hypothetical protein